ncbi:MAG TPA: YraN family protein [Luteibacter sp.]|jgi:putative endonuclease|nr:YraN family protein [Luteibacter sp.]
MTKPLTSKRLAGDRFEQQACEALVLAGLAVITRNFNTRFGELDLVMREGATVVFVEVRYRRSLRFGGAIASVTRKKQARLIRAAQCFLIAHPAHARRPCRFDVVGFHGDGASEDMQWLRAAFEAS